MRSCCLRGLTESRFLDWLSDIVAAFIVRIQACFMNEKIDHKFGGSGQNTCVRHKNGGIKCLMSLSPDFNLFIFLFLCAAREENPVMRPSLALRLAALE